MPDIVLDCKALKTLSASCLSNRTRLTISPISATFLQKENIHPNFVEELRSRKVLRTIPSIYNKKNNRIVSHSEEKICKYHPMSERESFSSKDNRSHLSSSINNHQSEWLITVLQLLIVTGIFMYVMFCVKYS
jgi:hypothetical protein